MKEDYSFPERIALSKEGWEAFIKLLENPPDPSPALVKLFKKYETLRKKE